MNAGFPPQSASLAWREHIFAALTGVDGSSSVPAEPRTPAATIKKSITPDYLICLEDGRPFKSLKRHLRSKYGLSPGEYRAKWGLPKTYPMVAPAYSAVRSNLAKQIGLGQGAARAKAKPAATKASKPRAKAG